MSNHKSSRCEKQAVSVCIGQIDECDFYRARSIADWKCKHFGQPICTSNDAASAHAGSVRRDKTLEEAAADFQTANENYQRDMKL